MMTIQNERARAIMTSSERRQADELEVNMLIADIAAATQRFLEVDLSQEQVDWLAAAAAGLNGAALVAQFRVMAHGADAPLPAWPMTPEEREAIPNYGDLASTVIWFPIRVEVDGLEQIVCRNCHERFSAHDLHDGSCRELALRAAHGDK